MTMTLFVDDRFDSDDSFYRQDARGGASTHVSGAGGEEFFHILEQKLSKPRFDGMLQRTRLDEMIEKSLSQFGATIISGRSGTGKTALAANFANTRKRVAWYSIESPDIEWKVFSRYFAASLRRTASRSECGYTFDEACESFSKNAISQFLSDIFSKIGAEADGEPILIVFDDLHHVFDAPWFGDFFNLLLHSLRENVHLLLLCRSRPPNPLWRLRSKQMLNVIDEKLLAFNREETTSFIAQSGLSEKTAQKVYADSFGRIAKVKQLAGRLSS
ncbi:MAG: AAA family ATPase [Pyrinomonadaceae bacterium]